MSSSTLRSSAFGMFGRFSIHSVLMASVGAAAVSLPTVAHAQEEEQVGGIQDIVVTAQRREQLLQDVPIAITALSPETLEANRVVNVRDLSGLVPNLQVREQPGSGSSSAYSMRGSVNSGTIPGSDKGIALYVDGVALGGLQATIFELADIQRVEVLRGPQGTLFGRNSTGGAINFITKEPTGEIGLKQQVSYGNMDYVRSRTTLSTPLIGDMLSAQATYSFTKFDGDIDNLGAGTRWNFTPAFGGRPTFFTAVDKLGGSKQHAFNMAVKFEPSPEFKNVYRFDYTSQRYSGGGFGLRYIGSGRTTATTFVNFNLLRDGQTNPLTAVQRGRPDAVNNWDTVPSSLKAWGHSLTSDWRVSDEVSVKNIISLRLNKYDAPLSGFTGFGGVVDTNSAEFAKLGSALVPAGTPFLPNVTTTNGTDKQFSEELQLTYDSDFLTVTVGSLYYWLRTLKATAGTEDGVGRARGGAFRFYPNFTIPFFIDPSVGLPTGFQLNSAGGRETNIVVKSHALYGQAEVHVTPQLDVVAGMRYTKDRKTGLDNSIRSRQLPTTLILDYKDSQTTFNLGVNYEFGDNQMVYAKYSTGYISGGSLGPLTYEAETAKSWEAGIKADFWDRKVRANLSVFHVKYDNLQVPTGGTTLAPGAGGLSDAVRLSITQAYVSAGAAKAKGVELETTFAPVPGLVLTANGGFLDFKYGTVNPILMGGLADFLPTYRPKWNATFSGQYAAPLGGDLELVARLDANWKSKQFGVAGVPVVSNAIGFTQAEQDKFIEAITIDPYWLVNGRLSLNGFKVGGSEASVALWGRNLFDSKSPQFVQNVSTFFVAASFERARSFGVDLSIEF